MGNMSILYTRTAEEIIIFLAFIFVCGALTKSRFTTKQTFFILLAGITFSAASNTAAFLGSHDLAFTLGFTPLTTFIPAIFVLHLLSDSGFFRTVPIWLIGLFTSFAGRFSSKATLHIFRSSLHYYYAIRLLILLVIMSAICIIVIKYIRRPFFRFVRYSDINWSIPLSLMLLLLVMLSYFYNSTYDSITVLLMFLIAIAAFYLIAKLLRTEFTKQQIQKEHDKYETHIQIQHKEFMEITQKHELLCEYRHDMRHHLLALGNILHNSDNTYAEKYVNSLMKGLEATEHISYSKNQMVNVVLSSYLTKAKEIGCVLDLSISIPEKLKIEDIDLCIVLSNALENAIHACEQEDEVNRHITIKLKFQNSLHICIKNTCSKTVAFDKNGLPISKADTEHGIGMKSIVNTVEKYNGIMQCKWEDNNFKLNIVMFNIVPEAPLPQAIHSNKPAFAVFYSIICICIFLNFSPTTANVLADIPVVGSIVQIITVKYHRISWGENKFEVKEPKLFLDTPNTSEQKNVSKDHYSYQTSQTQETENIAPKKTEHATQTMQNAEEPPAKSQTNKVQASSTEPNVNETPTSEGSHTDTNKANNTHIPASKTNTVTESETLDIALPTPNNLKKKIIISQQDTPVLEKGIEEMNQKITDYIETLRQKYNWYIIRKFMGYVALETDYTILCNDDALLSMRFDSTLNVGGSGNFCRCFTLDKRKGCVVELKDLFQDAADYITPISSYILEQMTIEVNNGSGNYFIPGGIWNEDECFKSISPEQNYYINDQGKLVIVFDEYQVAPGYMGIVEFTIPTNVIDTILPEQSLLR